MRGMWRNKLMKNIEKYEHLIATVKQSAKRKRNGKSSITAIDGTVIEATRDGDVLINGVKVN